MKIIKIILIIIIILLAGYLTYKYIFPLFNKSIEGTSQVQVEIIMNNGTPVPNIEVDLALKPGTPPQGGVAYTDDNGVAVFNVKPAQYYIYFNLSNFPNNLQMPESQMITVQEGIINKKTIILETKK